MSDQKGISKEKKGFLKRWLDRMDEKLAKRAKSSCCCQKQGGGDKKSCC